MNILKSIDIEDEVRQELNSRMTVYCRPLPETFTLPNLLITATGGTTLNEVDTFTVRLDARAETDAEASDYLRTALAILEHEAEQQVGNLRHVAVNSLASWGTDPVRPDVKLCTATVLITAHRVTELFPD